MRKKNKKILMWAILIIGILEILAILGQQGLFALWSAEKLQCSPYSEGVLSCSIKEGAVIGDAKTFGGQIEYGIYNSKELIFSNFNDIFKTLYENKYPEVREFFDTNPYSGVHAPGSSGYYWYVPKDVIENPSNLDIITEKWGNSRILKGFLEIGASKWKAIRPCSYDLEKFCTDSGCYAYRFDAGQMYTNPNLREFLVNQLMVVEGNMIERETGHSKPFKVYGVGDFFGTFKINEPAEMEGFAEETEKIAQITNIYVYLKSGGYNEEDVCVMEGIEKCVGTNVYECGSFGWNLVGEIKGKCGVDSDKKILPEKNIPSQIQPPKESQQQKINYKILLLVIGIVITLFIIVILFIRKIFK